MDENSISLFIEKDVDKIDLNKLLSFLALKEIKVDENNPYFSSSNSLLLSKDKTHLYFIPSNLKEINIPDSVKTFSSLAFRGITYDLECFNYPFSSFNEKTLPLPDEDLIKLCAWFNPHTLCVEYKKKIINIILSRLIDNTIPLQTKKLWVHYVYSQKRRFYKNPHVDLVLLLTSLTKLELLKIDEVKEALYICGERENKEAKDILASYSKKYYKNETLDLDDNYDNLRNAMLNLKKNWKFGFKSDNSLILSGYKGKDKSVTVPSFVGSTPVTSLSYGTFSPFAPHLYQDEIRQRENIEEVFISNNLIHTLSDSLCLGCKKLTHVSFSEGLEEIDQSAFSSCIKLNDLSFPSTLISINELAFAGCESITSITLPQNLKEVRDGAFSYCLSLKTVNINESIEEIGSLAFSGCRELKEINIPSTIKAISPSLFSNCVKLENITLPSSITEIGSCAFSSCKRLKNISFPPSLKRIAHNAFEGCNSFTSVTLNEGCEVLDVGCFNNCKELKEVTLPSSIKEIGEIEVFNDKCKGVFEGCINLSSITLPEGLTSIENNLFKNCINLTEITLPDTVVEIKKGAFMGCSNLRKVKLSKNLRKIGDKAFASCTSLEELYIPDNINYLSEEAFIDSGIKTLSFPFKEIGKDEYSSFNIERLNGITLIVRK